MELNEKLRELRKQKGLTQEELAEILFVSRTAISKWESGRGVPNIESLKAISKFFAVTLDDLLSGNELLAIAEDEHRQTENRSLDTIFGLLDCSMALFFFLPFFGQTSDGAVREVSLLALAGIQPYVKAAYFIAVFGIILSGILTLALQNCTRTVWTRSKNMLSVSFNALGVLLFILTRQPYAAAFSFVFLLIKALLMAKKR